MRRRVETIRRSPSRTSYAACRVAGSLRRKPPRATRRSTGLRGERRTERNTPAILARSDEETTSVAGRATPDKPPRADAPPRAAVGLGEWRAIRRRSPLQIYLRPAGGAAAPVGWRSIPPAVASRQWSLLSRGRLLHSHWALFEILQQDFVARFQGRVPASSRCRAIRPPPATATFAQPAAALDCLVHRKYLVWSFARAIECLTKNQDAMRLDPR